MFELKHLKSLKVLDEAASLKGAADVLAMSQSALSHQLKDLEHRIGQKLFERNTSPIVWSKQGRALLALAKQVLPLVEEVSEKLKPTRSHNIELTISIACHACFQWLFAELTNIQSEFPNLTLEFDDVIFEQSSNDSADILLTDEIITDDKYCYEEIGSFELIAVVPNTPFWQKTVHIEASDFKDQILLSYPVAKERLDIFTDLLTPANIEPKQIKPIANTHVILQMIANNMGVAALPNWVFLPNQTYTELLHKSIGSSGIQKTLYARYAKGHSASTLIKQLIPNIVTAYERFSSPNH
ncbi:LysR substrate-binding domain-containing protein [Thalassotalea fusca]